MTDKGYLVVTGLISFLLVSGVTYLLALLGEPQSLWLMRDVFGLIE